MKVTKPFMITKERAIKKEAKKIKGDNRTKSNREKSRIGFAILKNNNLIAS